RMLVCLALHQLDGVVDQVRVEVLDLLLRELDLLEARHDLVVGEEPLLQTVLYQLVKLFDVGKRDVDGEHLTSRLVCCACLRTYLETPRARANGSPGSPSCGHGCYTGYRKIETQSSQDRNGRGGIAVAVRDRHLLEPPEGHTWLHRDCRQGGGQRPRVPVGDLQRQ